MNERIKQLAEQAGVSIDGMGYGEGNIEELIKLIVRECAKYMYEQFPETRYKVNYMRKHMGDPEWNSTQFINDIGGGQGGSTFVCPPEENGTNMFSKYDGDGW